MGSNEKTEKITGKMKLVIKNPLCQNVPLNVQGMEHEDLALLKFGEFMFGKCDRRFYGTPNH